MKFIFYSFEDIDVNCIVDISSTDYEIKKQEMINYMMQCIDELTEIQKQRLTKYYFLGQTKVAIAKEEQVSEGAVRKSIKIIHY